MVGGASTWQFHNYTVISQQTPPFVERVYLRRKQVVVTLTKSWYKKFSFISNVLLVTCQSCQVKSKMKGYWAPCQHFVHSIVRHDIAAPESCWFEPSQHNLPNAKHQHTCHFKVGAHSAVIQSKHTWSNTLHFMMLYANLKLNTYALLKPSNPVIPVHQRESPGVFKPSSFLGGSLHQLFQLFKGPRALIYGKVCPWQYIWSKHKRKQEKNDIVTYLKRSWPNGILVMFHCI